MASFQLIRLPVLERQPRRVKRKEVIFPVGFNPCGMGKRSIYSIRS